MLASGRDCEVSLQGGGGVAGRGGGLTDVLHFGGGGGMLGLPSLQGEKGPLGEFEITDGGRHAVGTAPHQ